MLKNRKKFVRQTSNGSWISERGIYLHGLYQSKAFQLILVHLISVFFEMTLETNHSMTNQWLNITVAQHSRTFLSCPERVHVRVLPRCYESSCHWISWLIIDFKPCLYNFGYLGYNRHITRLIHVYEFGEMAHWSEFSPWATFRS